MSTPGRMKTYAGGDLIADSKRTVAVATTTVVPDFTNIFYLTGTATITSLTASPSTRNRLVTFVSSSGSQTFTNTNSPSANQMALGGANITISAGDSITMFLKIDGSWQIYNIQRANSAAVSVSTLASATTLTIPDTANVFYVSGSTTVTALSLTTNTSGRSIRLIGAANAAVPFTNTDTPATNGQMYLRGTNRLLLESTILDLQILSDGTSAGTYAILAGFTGG